MPFTHDTAEAIDAAAWLVNSRQDPDTLTTLDDVIGFFDQFGYSGSRPTASDVAPLREVRPRLRRLLTAERDAAVAMLRTLPPRQRRRTLGADKGYDSAAFVAGTRACGVTPHVAQNIHARKSTSAIDNRATRHAGYAMSQVKRKLVEEAFGWGKTIGGLRKLHQRGTPECDGCSPSRMRRTTSCGYARSCASGSRYERVCGRETRASARATRGRRRAARDADAIITAAFNHCQSIFVRAVAVSLSFRGFSSLC